MIYCDALFCLGHPHFVLLGLYHPSPVAINPPCLFLPIQRHIFILCPAKGAWNEIAVRLIINTERGAMEKTEEGLGVLGVQPHLGVGHLGRKEQGVGRKGSKQCE